MVDIHARLFLLWLFLLFSATAQQVYADPVLGIPGEEPPDKPLRLSFWMGFAGRDPRSTSSSTGGGKRHAPRFEKFASAYPELVTWEVNKMLRRSVYNIPQQFAHEDMNARAFVAYRADKVPRFADLVYAMANMPRQQMMPIEAKPVLMKMGKSGRALARNLFPHRDDYFFYGYYTLDPKAVPWLEDKLTGQSLLEEKTRAALSLAEYGSTAGSALPKLRPLLKDCDRHIRLAATGAVLAISPEDREALAILAVEKRSPEQDIELARALSFKPTREHLRTILQIWGKCHKERRGFSLLAERCVATIGEAAYPVIVAHIGECQSSTELRWCAQKVKLCASPPVDEAIKLLKSDSQKGRSYGEYLVGCFGPKAKSATTELLPRLVKEDGHIDRHIMDLLRKIGADPEDIALQLISAKPKDRYRVGLIIQLLRTSETLPDKARQFLLSAFSATPESFAWEHNLGILDVLNHHNALPADILQGTRTVLKKAPLFSGRYREYAIWFMENSDDPDSIATELLLTLDHGTVGKFALEYGRRIGDYRKALRLHDQYATSFMTSDYIKPKSYEDPVKVKNRTAQLMRALMRGFFCFLQEHTNLSDSERRVLLSNQRLNLQATILSENSGAMELLLTGDGKGERDTWFKLLSWSLSEINGFSQKNTDAWVAEAQKQLQTAEESKRGAIVRALGRVPPGKHQKRALQLLLATLQDPSDEVCKLAVESIDCFGAALIPELCEAIKHRDAYIGMEACRLLGEMSTLGKPAVPALLKVASEHPDWTIRASAVRALANIGDERAKPLFVEGLDDPRPLIRRESAIGLIYLGGIPAEDPMLSKIRDSGFSTLKGFGLGALKKRVDLGIPAY